MGRSKSNVTNGHKGTVLLYLSPCFIPMLRNKTGGQIQKNRPLVSQIIITTLKQFLHLLYARLTGIGASAGVCNGIHGYVMQSLKEYLLRHKALLSGKAILAIVRNALRNIHCVIHPAQILNQGSNLFIILKNCL